MEGDFIGGQLKAARKLRGVKTTKVLAGSINKPRFGERVIGAIERNQRRAQPHEIAWLAAALDLPAEFFVNVPTVEAPEALLAGVVRELGGVLQAIKTQLGEQTKTLGEMTETLDEIKDLLAKENAAAVLMKSAAEQAGRLIQQIEADVRSGLLPIPAASSEQADSTTSSKGNRQA